MRYQAYSFSKGGSNDTVSEGVELRLAKKLGAHDLTVIKVNDVSTFRKWVNDYFRLMAGSCG